jgi:hypothetical protein
MLALPLSTTTCEAEPSDESITYNIPGSLLDRPINPRGYVCPMADPAEKSNKNKKNM